MASSGSWRGERDLITVLDSPRQGATRRPSHRRMSKKPTKRQARTLSRPRTERTGANNPQDYNVKFDLEDYLHKDKIKEIMNIESLEESLDEVLTITGSEIEEMFRCRGSPGELAGQSDQEELEIFLSKGEIGDMSQSQGLLASLKNVSKDDLHSRQQRAEFDDLLAVPELEQVGTVNEEDMERMMRISAEMLDLDCNLQQADLDSLLNVDNFTEKQSSASLQGDKIIV